MKTVVVFQGGGALGAFSAGAWQVLAAQDDFGGPALAALAGTSIGAVNAAVVAHAHAAPDRGAAALLALWRERCATPSWPFFGAWTLPIGAGDVSAESWNGFMTGVLLGSRGLYSAAWPVWQPLSGLARLQQPLHDRQAMWDFLERELGRYPADGPDGPMLAVGAVDVMSGELVLFDSDSAPVTARHVGASSGLPILFEPVELEERLYWDGDITRDSVLPLLLQRLLDSRRVQADEPLRLVTIEQFPRALAARPQSGAELAYRAINLLQLDKLEPPALEGIRIEQWQRVVREPLVEDGVSGQFDYSPARLERLLEEGRQAARRAIERPAPLPVAASGLRRARARR